MSQSLNTGITVPALPRNERAYAFGIDALPATFGEGFGAQFDDQMVRNPTASIGRMLDRAQYFPSTDEFGNESPARTPSKILTAQEANDQYGIPGHLKFDADTPEPIAQELKTLKTREVERQDTMRRAQAGLGTALTAGLVASILDPLNVASAFIPVVGEARYAAMVARLGVTGARAARGAIEGAVGAAIVEPFTLAAASYEQADYDAADSLASIAFGTALGSGLHVAGGAVKDRFVGAVDNLPAADKEALLRTSVAQVAEGRPVDVSLVNDAIRLDHLKDSASRIALEVPSDYKVSVSWGAMTESALTQRLGRTVVLSETGNPLRVYHGTLNIFDQFDSAKLGSATGAPSAREGFFFSNDPNLAATYAAIDWNDKSLVAKLDEIARRFMPNFVIKAADKLEARLGTVEPAPNVRPQYLRMENPLVHDFRGSEYRDRTYAGLVAEAKAKGHDGLILRNTIDDGFSDYGRPADVYVAFTPDQIVSPFEAHPQVRAESVRSYAEPRLEPEGERFLADIERRFSEVQARPEAIADELKAVEAEMVELDRLLPADSEAKASTPAMQEANVYAKAWEEAVACRIRKA